MEEGGKRRGGSASAAVAQRKASTGRRASAEATEALRPFSAGGRERRSLDGQRGGDEAARGGGGSPVGCRPEDFAMGRKAQQSERRVTERSQNDVFCSDTKTLCTSLVGHFPFFSFAPQSSDLSSAPLTALLVAVVAISCA